MPVGDGELGHVALGDAPTEPRVDELADAAQQALAGVGGERAVALALPAARARVAIRGRLLPPRPQLLRWPVHRRSPPPYRATVF
jgi:hypothetical protein